jgi:hypothetical protein
MQGEQLGRARAGSTGSCACFRRKTSVLGLSVPRPDPIVALPRLLATPISNPCGSTSPGYCEHRERICRNVSPCSRSTRSPVRPRDGPKERGQGKENLRAAAAEGKASRALSVRIPNPRYNHQTVPFGGVAKGQGVSLTLETCMGGRIGSSTGCGMRL